MEKGAYSIEYEGIKSLKLARRLECNEVNNAIECAVLKGQKHYERR